MFIVVLILFVFSVVWIVDIIKLFDNVLLVVWYFFKCVVLLFVNLVGEKMFVFFCECLIVVFMIFKFWFICV